MSTSIQEAAKRADGELRDDDMDMPTPNVVMILLAQHGGRISYRRPEKKVDGFESDAPSRFGVAEQYRSMLEESIVELYNEGKIDRREYPISEPVGATHGKTYPGYLRVIVELA